MISIIILNDELKHPAKGFSFKLGV